MMAVYARSLIDAVPARPSGSLVDEVNRLIHLFLPIGRATIEQAAHLLERGVRSLQRERGAAGTTFSALLTALVLRVLRCPERDGLLIRDPEQPWLDLEVRID